MVLTEVDEPGGAPWSSAANLALRLVLGGVSAVLAQFCVHPIELVKVRLQVRARSARCLRGSAAAAGALLTHTQRRRPLHAAAQNDGVGGVAKKYTSFGSAGATVFREEGLRALYKGFTAAAVRRRRRALLSLRRAHRPRPRRAAAHSRPRLLS